MKKVISVFMLALCLLSSQAMAEVTAGGNVYSLYLITGTTNGSVGAFVINLAAGQGIQCGYNAFNPSDTAQQAIVRAAMFSAIVAKLSLAESTGKPIFMMCDRAYGEITEINSSFKWVNADSCERLSVVLARFEAVG